MPLKQLGLHWHDDPLQLGVWRDGKRRNLGRNAAFLYRAGDGDGSPAPIHAKWGGCRIYVEAGGEAFGCAVDNAGRVEFTNGSPELVRPDYVRATH